MRPYKYRKKKYYKKKTKKRIKKRKKVYGKGIFGQIGSFFSKTRDRRWG